MRKLPPAFLDDRPSFLFRPTSTIPLVTNPAVVQLDQNGSTPAGADVLAPLLSEMERNNNNINNNLGQNVGNNFGGDQQV